MAALAGAARADPPPLLEVPPAKAPTGTEQPTLSSAPPEQGGQFTVSTKPDGTSHAIARKDALLEMGGFRAHADEIDLDQIPDPAGGKPNATAEATGQVTITHEALRVLTRKMNFDSQKQVLTTTALRTGIPLLNLDASSLTLGNGTATLENARLYFHEPDPYGLSITADRAIYTADTQEVEMQGATLHLGTIPFFYLSDYVQGQQDQEPLSMQEHFGSGGDRGLYEQSTIFWMKNPELSPGVLLDYYSRRGALAGPALKYDYTDDPDWEQQGTMESGYIHDTGDRGLDLNNNPIGKNRFFVDWEHHGTVDGVVDITSSMYWWSDSYVLRDFRQNQWSTNQLPDNFVEAIHRDENSFISAFARYQPNDFEIVQQRLPEVRFDYMPSPLGVTGIYQEGQASFAQLVEQNLTGAPTLHSDRFDSYYGWRRPINIDDWATITPVVGARLTDYMDTLNNQGNFARMLGQVGVDAEMRAFGRWDYDAPAWGINGIQHIVRPVMMYRYIPAAQQGAGQIPVIDADTFSPYPPIVDLGDTRSVDQLFDTSLLRYGVENLFQTRDGNYGSRDLASLSIYNDIHFTRAPGDNDFSDIWAGLGLYPANWLHFDVFNRFDPSADTERELHTRTTLIDGDQWTASFFTDNLQHQVAQYGIEARYHISERTQLLGRWTYDQHFGGLTEQSYALRTRLGNSWDVEYGISYTRGALNENGFAFNVRFTLLTY